MSYTLTAERAHDLPLGVPLTLETDNVAKPLKVEHVYALDVGAASRPQQRVVRVADRRWLWARRWVSSSFNVRRIAGESSLQTEAGQPIELAQLDPVIRYAKWSLDPPDDGAIVWTARRVLEFVFQQLEQPYRFADEPPETPIQDLEIEDWGHNAVERVLGYLPGADLFIDYDGTAVVFDALKAVQEAPEGLARKHVGLGGDMVMTSRKALRPSAVAVLFTPEVECRFDSQAEGGTRVRDTPTLVNVAPSPDLTVTLSTGQTVARGTYVALSTLFDTWGSFGLLSEALSFSKLADYGAAASVIEQLYSRSPGGQTYDPVSGGRARAAVNSWRRLWQIDESFVQRIASIRASRVAVLNPVTGTRARSEAYCDFLRRPNKKNPQAKGFIESSDYGWYDRGYSTLLADCVAAPATVSVVSETAGVIRIEPQLDPWGISDAILLGYPENTQVPGNSGDADANRTGVDAFAQWARVKLTDDFQVATVLTVVPASPNTLGRLHRVVVSAGEAGTDGDGPIAYVRVMPGIMTARFAWSDEQAEAIKGSILRGDPRPSELLVNAKDVQNVALAYAKEFYAGLSDTPDTRSGPVSVDMNPDLKPFGSVGHVRHGLTSGKTTTRVMATGIRRPADPWRFMDGNTRRVVMRLANEVES
jgi:hypothetical protein